MRNNFIFLILISFFTFLTPLVHGQKIAEDKVDEFTKRSIKRTSWEILNQDFKFSAFFRISEVENIQTFDLKLSIGTGEVFSIDEGQKIMFILDNEEVISLHNLRYKVTCTGCGARGFAGSRAQGIQVSYLLKPEVFEKLLNNQILKVRIYTSKSYVESDINAKAANRIINSLKLM